MEEIKTPNVSTSQFYSQALRAGGFVFVSGQIALDPVSGKMIEGGVIEQTKRVLQNIETILTTANLSLQHLVKVEIYLKDIKDFSVVNALYLEKISYHPKPTRQAMQVGHLPLDALIEISCIAVGSL